MTHDKPVAIVTGAGSDIGQATAMRFAQVGPPVVIAGIPIPKNSRLMW